MNLTTVARKVSPAPDLPATDAKPEPDGVVQFVPWIPYLPLFGGVMAFTIYVVGWIVLVSR